MELLSSKKVRIVLFVFILLCLVLIGLYIYKSSKNPYGNQLEIVNLDKYLAGKQNDNDSLNYIKHNLYTAINLNTHPAVKNNSVKDILVRNESFSDTYDSTKHVYTIHFIVDIKSLKQSYRVQYQWVTNPTYGPNKDDYGTQVTCLPLSELIYGDFHCKDARILEQGLDNYDPVGLLLPYHVESKYKITSYTKVGGSVVLYVDAYAPGWVVKLDQATLNGYTEDIKAWLKKNGLNPDKYIIHYTNE